MNRVSAFAFRLLAFMCQKLPHDCFFHCKSCPVNVEWVWATVHGLAMVKMLGCFIKAIAYNFPTTILPVFPLQSFHWAFNNTKHSMFLSMNHQILLHNSLTICLQLLGNLHHWLGHKGFHDLQKWAAEGINGIPSDVMTCLISMCHACQYGAAKKWSHETNNTGSVVGTPKGPGNFVSVDQMIAGSPGLIPFDSGCPSTWWYKSVTMWVDHFSHYLYAQCHEQATIQSALKSKESFELFAKCIMFRSNTFTVTMVSSWWRLSKIMSLPVISSNLFVVLACIGRIVSLNVTLMSSPQMLTPCYYTWCKCSWMLPPQSSGVMLSPCSSFTQLHTTVKQNKIIFHSIHRWWYDSYPKWFQSVWITGLCSWPVFTVWFSWSWKMEREILSGGIHWSFTAPCMQCHSCVQPEDSTGISTIPHCSWWIIQNCLDQHIWSRFAAKTGQDVGCFICYISMDTQWCIFWLWSINHFPSLSQQQLGFHEWNYPCHCKCHPDGYLLKHKSQICADGSQQQYSIN